LWENILGGKLGRKKVLGMNGAEFLATKKVHLDDLEKGALGRGHEKKEGSGVGDPMWKDILGGKLGRKKVLGMSGTEFLATKKTEVIKLSAKVREKVAHHLFVRTHTHTALFGDKRNSTRRRVNPHDCHTNAHTQQKDGGHAGIVTAPRLVDVNRAVCVVYDNVLRLLDGQVHTLFPATNVAKVTKSHVTDTLKALRADGWKQSFPRLFSDVYHREGLINALDALDIALKAKNTAQKALYGHYDGRTKENRRYRGK